MFRWALPCLALWGWHASGAEFRVRVDISRAPQLTDVAQGTEALIREWYPKLNAALWGPDRPLPFDEVIVVYAPTVKGADPAGRFTLQGLTFTNRIAMPADFLEKGNWDYRPLVIHELAHVCQHYHLHLRCTGIYGLSCFIYTRFTTTNPGLKWLTEGMAEFALQKFYLQNLEPSLRLDGNKLLTGYDDAKQQLHGLEQKRVALDRRGYTHGYQVAAAFLLWLEQRKASDIVRRLNLAMEHGKARDSVFRTLLGCDLDTLWAEFLNDSATASTGSIASRR